MRVLLLEDDLNLCDTIEAALSKESYSVDSCHDGETAMLYALKTPEDTLEDRFVEACQMHCHIEYMADVLTVGDLEERVALVDELMKEGKITFLQEYITRKKKEVAHHGEEPENA